MSPCCPHSSFTCAHNHCLGLAPGAQDSWLIALWVLSPTKEIEGSDWMQTSSKCSHPSFSGSSISIGPRLQSWGRNGELFHFLFPKGICMTSVSGDSLLGHLILTWSTSPTFIPGWLCQLLPPPVKQTCLIEKICSVWRNRWASGTFPPIKSALSFGSPSTGYPFLPPW